MRRSSSVCELEPERGKCPFFKKTSVLLNSVCVDKPPEAVEKAIEGYHYANTSSKAVETQKPFECDANHQCALPVSRPRENAQGNLIP